MNWCRFCLYLMILMSLPLLGYAKPKNICKVLKVHPSWLKDAKKVQKKWGVPVSVQLAIVQEESHFKADAKNKRSTAFGYAQVENGIWHIYKKNTKQYKQKRNNFRDATDFIGWYADRMQKQVNVSPASAYELYLSYHDGATGYLSEKHSKKKTFSKNLAHHVQLVANRYKVELVSC